MSLDDTVLWRSSGEWSVVPPRQPPARSGDSNPFPRNLLGNGPAQALLGGGPLRPPDATKPPSRRPSARRGAPKARAGKASRSQGGRGDATRAQADPQPKAFQPRGTGQPREPRQSSQGRASRGGRRSLETRKSRLASAASAQGFAPPPADRSADAPADRSADGPANRYSDVPAGRHGDGPGAGYADAPADRYADGAADRHADEPGAGYAHDPAVGDSPGAATGYYTEPDEYRRPPAHPAPEAGGYDVEPTAGVARRYAPDDTTASRPRHRRVRRPRQPRLALSQPTGPHVRLGIVWAAATFGILWLGAAWAAPWLAVVAAMAAGTAIRTWGTHAVAPALAHKHRARVQPPAAVAALMSAAITFSALGGGGTMAVAAGSATLILAGASVFGPMGRPGLIQRVLIVAGPGVAAGSLVLARSQGLATGLVLAGMVTVYDSSAYLIGTGAPNRWEGSVAGAASIAALTLTVAAVLSPPFTGTSPWLFGAGAAVLAPVGVALCRWITGDKDAPVPALRRLDSLLLLGPAWAAAVAVVLHR